MSIGLGAGDGKAAVIVSADFSSGQRTLSLQDLSTKILYKIAKGNSAEPVLGFQKKPHAVLLSHCIKCLGTRVVQRHSIGLVIDTAQGSTLTWYTASNIEQVANLLCAQANSVSYPQRDGK